MRRCATSASRSRWSSACRASSKASAAPQFETAKECQEETKTNGHWLARVAGAVASYDTTVIAVRLPSLLNELLVARTIATEIFAGLVQNAYVFRKMEPD